MDSFWQMSISAGLKLDVQEPRRPSADTQDGIGLGPDRVEAGAHWSNRTIRGKPCQGEPGPWIGLDEKLGC